MCGCLMSKNTQVWILNFSVTFYQYCSTLTGVWRYGQNEGKTAPPPHHKTKRYPKSLILSNVYLPELNSLESVKRVRLATFERNYVWHFLNPLTLIWGHASNKTALRPSFRETVTYRNKLRKINLFDIRRGLSGATIFQFGLQEHKKALTWKFRCTVRKNRP